MWILSAITAAAGLYCQIYCMYVTIVAKVFVMWWYFVVAVSVCAEGRGQWRAAATAASQQPPGGAETGKPGEGVYRGDLRLRGGARGL